MGEILDCGNEHIEVEVRRESFIIHDDARDSRDVAPEFGYERVYALQALIQQIIEHPRFVAWREKKERQR